MSFVDFFYIYSKYDWVIPFKDKKSIAITNAFQKILDDSSPNPSKKWVDKASEFCNRSMKSWLEDNDIEMHFTHNEEKSVAAKTFIRTLENKIYRCLASISKNI